LLAQWGLFALPASSHILQSTITQFLQSIQVYQHILILLPPSQSGSATYAMKPRSQTSKTWQWEGYQWITVFLPMVTPFGWDADSNDIDGCNAPTEAFFTTLICLILSHCHCQIL
jgi:hypothetical protein